VILYCPECRTATLIQFFFNPSHHTSHIPPAVLKTFRDHRHDGMTDWAVFDIRATLPDTLVLRHHHFKTGNYLLEFSNKHQMVQLKRWAPASVFLREQTLAQFAEAVTGVSRKEFQKITVNACKGIESQSMVTGGLTRWLSGSIVKPRFRVWRIWHLRQKNRILGVKLAGKGSINSQTLDTLCSAYDSL
jgi:hypothetical protein